MVNAVCVAKNFLVAVIGEHFQRLFHREIAAVQEALLIGDVIGMVVCAHGEPLNAVADLFSAAFGEKVIARIAGDADDFGVNAGLVLNAPEGDVVGSIVIANNALWHDPFAAVAHQKEYVVARENNAARTTSDCSSQE